MKYKIITSIDNDEDFEMKLNKFIEEKSIDIDFDNIQFTFRHSGKEYGSTYAHCAIIPYRG